MKKIINKLFAVIISLVAIVGIIPCGVIANADENNSVIKINVSGTYDYDAAFEYLDLVNELRTEKGYEKWQMTTELLEVAMRRAQEASLYFEHEKPDGTSIMFPEVLTNVGKTPQEALTSFENSPSHFSAIMMNDVVAEKYGEHYYTGVGCYKDNDGRCILIQCLMKSDGCGDDSFYTKNTANKANYPSEKIVTTIIPVNKELIKPDTWVAQTYQKNYNNEYKCTEYNYDPDTNIGNIKIKMSNENATTISSSNFNYSSSNSNVAIVDSTGQYNLGNVGTTTIRATLKDDSTIYFERNITVNPKNITEWDCSLPKGRLRYDYSGEVIKPQVTVDPWFGTPLTPNQDYTVKYTDLNGVECNPKEIGKYKCIVEGKGNYTGTCELEWGIYKCSHKETVNKIQQPTCTEDGFENTICVNCKENLNSVKIRAKGHQYTSKITKSATCTVAGVKTYTCSNCNDSYTESIPVTGHKFSEWTTDTPNTCITGGIRTRKCSNCNKVETSTVPAMGHKYSSSWTIDKVATCSSEGSKSHHCTICGDKKDITSISKLSHKYDEGKITVQPTCTNTGIKSYNCKYCGNIKTETMPKISHNYISEVTKEPTCTEDGQKKVFCTMCNENRSESVSKKGHNYTNKVTKLATCIDNGVISHVCTVCNNSYTETIKATGHKFGSWETTKKATCKATGIQTRKCSLCGKIETKTIVKSKTHSYKNVTINSTYFTKGYTGKKCSVCGTITSKKAKALLTMAAPKASGNSTSSLRLSWSKVKDAKGYVVYQNGKKIKTVTGTSLTVSKLKDGTTYKFTIKPYNSKKVYGNQSKILTTSTKSKAVSLKVTAGKKKATLKWNKVSGATGYKVYYKTSKNGKWKLLKTASNKTTSYTKTKLSSKKTYWFKVDTVSKVSGKIYTTTGSTKSVKIK